MREKEFGILRRKGGDKMKKQYPGVKIVTLGAVFAQYYEGSLCSVSGNHQKAETKKPGGFLLELSVSLMEHDVILAVGDSKKSLNKLQGRIKNTVALFCEKGEEPLSVKWFYYKGEKTVCLLTCGAKQVYIIRQHSAKAMEVFSRYILPEISREMAARHLVLSRWHKLRTAGEKRIFHINQCVLNARDYILNVYAALQKRRPALSYADGPKPPGAPQSVKAKRKRFMKDETIISQRQQSIKNTEVVGELPECPQYAEDELDAFCQMVLQETDVSGVQPQPMHQIPGMSIPQKAQPKVSLRKRCVAGIACAVFLFCAGYLVYYYGVEPQSSAEENQGLAQLYGKSYAKEGVEHDVYTQGGTASSAGETDISSEVEKAENLQRAEMLEQFQELYAMNSDLVGWITVPGTVIDYPVVKSADNSFYLDHNFYKEKNRFGAIYADEKNEVTQNGNSTVMLLYGHQTVNGSMFGELKKYRNLEFYKENPIFTFDTLYEKGEWKVFSVFLSNVDPAQDNGELFNWRVTEFGDKQKMMEYVEQCRQRSLLNTQVDVDVGDSLVALTVCASDFDNARLVVVARKVRADESAEVDTGKAAVNKTPLYPQIWYDLYGGVKPSGHSFIDDGSDSYKNEEETYTLKRE